MSEIKTLTIKAKENAQVEVIDGNFPLGQRNVIDIQLEDTVLNEYFQLVGTGTCEPKDNLVSYGEFSGKDESDLETIKAPKMKLSIAHGYAGNESNCLHAVADPDKDRFDEQKGKYLCTFVPDTDLELGTEYVLSMYVLAVGESKLYLKYMDDIFPLLGKEDKWQTINHHFVTPTQEELESGIMPISATADDGQDWWTNFRFELELIGRGEFYADSIQLFKASDEIMKNMMEGVDAQIKIVNPPQMDNIIDEVIKLTPEHISMSMFPITVVDYQDNLACVLEVFFNQAPKLTRQGDTMYREDKVMIYKSDIFVLNGYVTACNGSDKPDIINPGAEGSSSRYQLAISQI